jgi:alpha-tubulin suppressor-like RCC1 family protein
MKSSKLIIFLLIILILENTAFLKSYTSNALGENYVTFEKALELNSSISASTNSHFVKVEAGGYFSVALKSDGTVVAWGKNTSGQCDVPEGLHDVIDIQAGFNHTIALKKDGTVVAWGNNAYGQCDVPKNLSSAKSIATSFNHSVALTDKGEAVAWGMNDTEQCKIPSGITNIKQVVTMQDSTIILLNDGTVNVVGKFAYYIPNSINVKEISSGYFNMLCLNKDGTVASWGSNSFGLDKFPFNMPSISTAEGGWHHSIAITQQGRVVAWGDNSYGQCNVPILLDNVISVSAGYTHSLALKSDGTVVGWGDNMFGQIDSSSISKNIRLNLTDMYNKGELDITTSRILSEPNKYPILNFIDGDDTTFCYTDALWDGTDYLDINFIFSNPEKITEIRTNIGRSHCFGLSLYCSLVVADNYYDLNNKTGSYKLISSYVNDDGSWDKFDISEGLTRKIWSFRLYRQTFIDGSAYFSDFEFYIANTPATAIVTPTMTASSTTPIATPPVTSTITPTTPSIATPTSTPTVTPIATPPTYTIAHMYTTNPNIQTTPNNANVLSTPSISATATATATPIINEMTTSLPGADNKPKIGQPTPQTNTALIKPDLIITNIECYPENPKSNEWVNLNVKVKNIGSAPIKQGEKIVVSFYANDSGKIICKSTEYKDGLSVGKTINLLSYKNNNGGFVAKEPIYKLTAIIDSSNSIDEADENNNISVRRFFWDLPSNHWARKEVLDLVSRSILSGKTTLYTFRPDDYITRAELVTALVRMLGKDDANADIPFKDVKKMDWFYQYVVSAYNKGLVLGKSKDAFRPEDRISRQDMAVIFMRIIEKYNPDGTLKTADIISSKDKTNADMSMYLSKFTDNKSISDYARNGIGTLVKYSLIKGKDGGKIDPLGYITRAETATLMYRYYNLGK